MADIDNEVEAIELIGAIMEARKIANAAMMEAGRREIELAQWLGSHDMCIERDSIVYSAVKAETFDWEIDFYELVEDYPDTEDQ